MDKWEDESFVAEMEASYNYYLNGGKMVTAEEFAEFNKNLFASLPKSRNRIHAKRKIRRLLSLRKRNNF